MVHSNTVNLMPPPTPYKPRPKIFVPNKGCHDLSMAEKFGDLTYLTRGKISILSIGKMFRAFYPHISSSTKDDLILISGPSIMTSILCSMFSVKHGVLNLLIFQMSDNSSGQYKQRRISFEEFLQVETIGDLDND